MKLIKFETDWADEMSIEGHEVVTDEIWEEFLLNLDLVEFPFELYFGTNEFNLYEHKQDLLQELNAKDINDDEIEVLNRYGILTEGFTVIEQIKDQIHYQNMEESK